MSLLLQKAGVGLLVMGLATQGWAGTRSVTIDPGTRVYVVTQGTIVGKKKQASEGQIIPAKVWRDVLVDDAVVIEAGATILVRIDSLKKAKMAGRKGDITLGAYEVHAVDGTTIQLSGGYNKEGRGRMAGSIVGAVFLWPIIFLKGKAAELPSGTVFDAYTALQTECEVEEVSKPRTFDLSGILSEFSVEVLYDEIEKQEKPKDFAFRLQAPLDAPREFVIDSINGNPISPIPMNIRSITEDDDVAVVMAAVSIKILAKQFAKGINRFDVAYFGDGERIATEVVLDIQF